MGQTPGQNMQLQIAAATWRIEMKSNFAFCQITLVLVNSYLRRSEATKEGMFLSLSVCLSAGFITRKLWADFGEVSLEELDMVEGSTRQILAAIRFRIGIQGC